MYPAAPTVVERTLLAVTERHVVLVTLHDGEPVSATAYRSPL